MLIAYEMRMRMTQIPVSPAPLKQTRRGMIMSRVAWRHILEQFDSSSISWPKINSANYDDISRDKRVWIYNDCIIEFLASTKYSYSYSYIHWIFINLHIHIFIHLRQQVGDWWVIVIICRNLSKAETFIGYFFFRLIAKSIPPCLHYQICTDRNWVVEHIKWSVAVLHFSFN